MSVKIIWVDIEHIGPASGVAEWNNEKVWFSRIGLPSIISTNNDELPEVVEGKHSYALYSMPAEHIEELTKEHKRYADETGMPFLHGDPIKRIRKGFVVKYDKETVAKVSKTTPTISAQYGKLGVSTVFQYQTNFGTVEAKLVHICDESDFSNYLVPCPIVD